MISSINSSSISLALRTAQRAEKTLSKSVEQIATGKRVASVKDDGAAWVRAANAKSELSQIDARKTLIALYKNETESASVEYSAALDALDEMKRAAIGALSYPAGSDARKALAAQYTSYAQAFLGAKYAPAAIVSGVGMQANGTWGIQTTTQDPLLNGTGITTTLGAGQSAWIQNANSGYAGSTAENADIANTTNANLNTLITNLDGFQAAFRFGATNSVFRTDNSTNWLTSLEKISAQQEDRLNQSIESLTDIDMGKVSRDRDLAQTRQQLAYQTVRNAISQYGNVSSSLLNNVMGTQRSVRA